MGANYFCLEMDGKTAKEAFEYLYSEASREYGEDAYNGTISTCSLGRCVKKFAKYTKGLEKSISEDDLEDKAVKWKADYLDLGVCKYVVTKMKKTHVKPAKPAKWQQLYVVRELWGQKVLYKSPSRKEAEDWVLKNCDYDDVIVEKQPFCVEGQPLKTTFSMTRKEYSTKPKLKAGEKMVEIHKYIFYGLAAC